MAATIIIGLLILAVIGRVFYKAFFTDSSSCDDCASDCCSVKQKPVQDLKNKQ